MKIKHNPFQTRQIGDNLVEVWLGEPAQAESEFICSVSIQLLPQLIATLRNVQEQ
jgi:hypothetical protein